MAMEKQKRLVRLLFEKTASGTLDWKETLEEKGFRVSFASGGVNLVEFTSSDGGSSYILGMINDDGVIVDTFSDVDLDEDEDDLRQPFPWHATMKSLYDTARRTALGSEQVLNKILIELGDVPF